MRNCEICQTPVGCRASGICMETCYASQKDSTLTGTQPNEAPRTATQAPLASAPREAQIAALAMVAHSRRCETCRWRERNLALPMELQFCLHPALPENVINGRKRFPVIIARGYDSLCGPLGVHWERR